MSRHPRVTNTDTEVIGQSQSHIIPALGDIDKEDFRASFETVDTPVQSSHTKELLFMEEMVTILIPIGANPEAEEEFIDVGNNGVRQFIKRGEEQQVKRKFVEVLARAKREKISTPEFTDANGARSTKLIRTPALIHGFQVIEDKNPNGHTWLRRILAEA